MNKEIGDLVKENNELLFNILIKKYKDIIKLKVLKYNKNNSFTDDYINEIELSIYKAVENTSSNTILNAYINKCIDNTIINYYNYLNNNKNKILNESFPIIDNQELYKISSNPENIFFDNLNYINLKNKIINKLTWKEELIFILKEQNYTIKEISEITDNSLRTVYNIINRIKLKVSNLCQVKVNGLNYIYFL